MHRQDIESMLASGMPQNRIWRMGGEECLPHGWHAVYAEKGHAAECADGDHMDPSSVLRVATLENCTPGQKTADSAFEDFVHLSDNTNTI